MLATAVTAVLSACGPHVRLPALPVNTPGTLAQSDSGAVLARQLAPTLYLQRDETFPLSRAVAVLHPRRRVIAYYLLWEHDVVARWSPFSAGIDEEEVWVGYDSTHAPTDLWTYWHGSILHADWRGKGQVLVDVQWGKHGSLPHGAVRSDLPQFRSLEVFYAMTWLLPDLLLGRLSSPGPLCFCHDFQRYLQFTRPLPLAPRLDAIGRTDDPNALLTAVFGPRYAHKTFWPWPHSPEAGNPGEAVSGRAALLEEAR
jgi:hypothetical protein